MAMGTRRRSLFVVVVPSDLPVTDGLVLDLDATKLDLNDNDPVATWPDSSGAGNDATQETASKQFTYVVDGINGKASVRGDGTEKDMTGPASLTQPFTAFFVSRLDSESVLFDRDGSGDRGLYVISQWNTDRVRLYAGKGIETGAGVISAAAHLIATESNGADSKIWVDGVQEALGDAGLLGLSRYTLGNDVRTYNKYLDGDIAQVAIYDRALTTQEREDVEAHLTSKWGLA